MKLYIALNCCKDGVIFTHSNALSWPHFGTSLANDNVAWNSRLTTKDFYTKPSESRPFLDEPPAFLCAIPSSPYPLSFSLACSIQPSFSTRPLDAIFSLIA